MCKFQCSIISDIDTSLRTVVRLAFQQFLYSREVPPVPIGQRNLVSHNTGKGIPFARHESIGGSGGITPLILYLGAKLWSVVSCSPRPL